MLNGKGDQIAVIAKKGVKVSKMSDLLDIEGRWGTPHQDRIERVARTQSERLAFPESERYPDPDSYGHGGWTHPRSSDHCRP